MRVVIPLVVLFTIIGLAGLLNPAFANTSDSHPFILEWGQSGIKTAGFFSFPQNIATDDLGNVYVTDLGNMRVQKFNNNGVFLNAWGSSGSGSGQFKSPAGIAIFDDSVFVVDSQLHRVQKFDLEGTFITKWGSEGPNAGEFLLPNGIAVGNNGTVYVVDTGNARIQKFTSDGVFVSEFGVSGMQDGDFLNPMQIVIDRYENVYVADPGKNKIYKFDSNGVYSQTFGPHAGGLLISPQGMEIDPFDNIYVADTNYDRILRIDPNGATLTTWGTMGITKGQFKIPSDVAIDPNGFIFVVDSNGHRIQKFGTPFASEIQEPVSSEPETTTQVTESTTQESEPESTVTPVPGDLTKPVITPPNNLLIEATAGLTDVYVGQAMATDVSGIQSLESNAPEKFPLGVSTIIWTAIDGAGNMGIATQTITVVDTIPPVISSLSDITIEAQSPSSNPVSLENPATSDVVGVISITNDAPTVFPLGETVVTWIATDVGGNSASATQKVNVVDTTAPKLTIPEDIVVEATSYDQNEIYLGEAVVIDNGEIISITNDSPQFFGIGNTTVTWIAADAAGNIASRDQLVSVIDTTAPVLTLPADIVFEATSDTANFIELVEPTVVDVQNVTLAHDAPNSFPLGETVVNWVVVDPDDNFATTSNKVTVVDTTPPNLIIPDDVTVEASGNENNVAVLGNSTADDITSIPTIINNAPDTFPFGITLVTWTATDNHGNFVSYIQTVNVTDTIPPKITAPNDIVVEATDPEQNFVELSQPQVHDLIAVESVTNDAPDSFPIGMTTVTWSATDTSGNQASDTQVVTVHDTMPPILTIPTNVVSEATSSSGMPIIIGEAIATDVIGVASITNNAPAVFYIGETQVVWTTTDLYENTITAIQNVTVLDTTAPFIIPPPNVVFEAQDSTSNVVAIGVSTTDDIVGVISVENDAPTVFPLGDSLVTWTATDAAGNFATATQRVSIVDSTPPSIIAPESVEVEATSALETTAELGNVTASDFIGIDSITNDAPSAFLVGQTIVTWTATDLSGLTSTDTQIVTVVDTTPPTISVPAITTVEATSKDQNIVDFGTIVADDLVGIASISNDAPLVFPFGLTTITWSVTDDAGNVATATQKVSIIDTTSPSIVLPADIVIEALNADENLVNLGNAQTSDAVGVAEVTNDAPPVFSLGETTVTWTATDSSGNMVNATQLVSVIDTTSPTISPAEDILVEATSPTNNIVSFVAPLAQDFVSEVTISNDAPDTFPLGDSLITWTATDEAGNLASITQKITIVDKTAPELTIPDNVIIDATALETPVFVGEASVVDLTDSSPIITNDAPYSFPLGETIVTWTAVDSNGNSVSSTQTVNVQACGKPESYYNMILGTQDDDILYGTSVADLIFAYEGDDIVFGFKGNDCIFGGDGEDIIFGNEGNDSISGGDGNDILKGQLGMDILNGNTGVDVIDGGDDNDSCNTNQDSDGDIEVKCES